MTKEEYLRKVAEMQTDISAIKQEGGEESKTCNACIHNAVCYRYSYGLPENYADKCGDYLQQKSGEWEEGYENGYLAGQKNISERFERQTGKWILAEETIPIHERSDKTKNIFKITGYKCSVCGKTKKDHILSMYAEKTDFCPNCGADMRGAE